MGKFKQLVNEIREMDFDGLTPKQISDIVGLSEYQIIEILDADIIDPYRWADVSADLDSEHYGKSL